MMSNKSFTALIFACGIAASSIALADHNSVWGSGWANMPNDIHNTRIEDDNETFLELVQQGGGADSVNRYDDTSTTTSSGSSRMTATRSSGVGSIRTSGMGSGGRR